MLKKKAQKKWTRGEWSLLLLPLIVVIGLYVFLEGRQSLQKRGELKLTEAQGELFDVCWSPDGRLLVAGGGDFRASSAASAELLLWDAETGQLKNRLVGHTSRIYSMHFSQDGRSLLSLSKREIIAWDPHSGVMKYRWNLRGVFSGKWGAQNQFVVLTDVPSRGTVARSNQRIVLDIVSGSIVSQLPLNAARTVKAEEGSLVSPNGKFAVRRTPIIKGRYPSGHLRKTGGNIEVWDRKLQKRLHSIQGSTNVRYWWDERNHLRGISTVRTDHQTVGVAAFKFDPTMRTESWHEFFPYLSGYQHVTDDFRFCVVYARENIHVFDADTLKELKSWPMKNVYTMQKFSPANDKVACIEGNVVVIRDIPKLES